MCLNFRNLHIYFVSKCMPIFDELENPLGSPVPRGLSRTYGNFTKNHSGSRSQVSCYFRSSPGMMRSNCLLAQSLYVAAFRCPLHLISYKSSLLAAACDSIDGYSRSRLAVSYSLTASLKEITAPHPCSPASKQ